MLTDTDKNWFTWNFEDVVQDTVSCTCCKLNTDVSRRIYYYTNNIVSPRYLVPTCEEIRQRYESLNCGLKKMKKTLILYKISGS